MATTSTVLHERISRAGNSALPLHDHISFRYPSSERVSTSIDSHDLVSFG